MKFKYVLMAVVVCAAAAGVAHAQGGTVTSGCGNSPENPTVILGLVGSASGFLVAARGRFLRRK